MRRSASIAGTVGPLLFLAVLIVEGAARPGYRPLHDTISELSFGPRGWIQTGNFIVFGMLFVVFARGVKAGLDDSRAARAGAALLSLIGLGVLGAGLFRAERWPPSSMSLTGVLHLVSAMVLVFALMPVATAVLMRAFAADVRWRSLAAATGLTSVATFALLGGGIALMSPPGQPPRIGDEYAGLIQRIDVVVFLAWQLAVARRLARVQSTTPGPTAARGGRTAS